MVENTIVISLLSSYTFYICACRAKNSRRIKAGFLLESEIPLTRVAKPFCSSFLVFFLHIFFVHLHFSGSGIIAVIFLFFFASDVNGSSASRTALPQNPRTHFLFFLLFVSDSSCVALLVLLPQTERIHEQQHAHLSRLQLRMFLQQHLLAELNSPMELPDRRESGRAPSCRSLHANEEQQEASTVIFPFSL